MAIIDGQQSELAAGDIPRGDPFHPLTYIDRDNPIYGQWFDKNGCGPTTIMLELYPLPPMPGRINKLEDFILLLCVKKSPAEQFNFGNAPIGAGPSFSRGDIALLHAQLGRWLEATATAAAPDGAA